MQQECIQVVCWTTLATTVLQGLLTLQPQHKQACVLPGSASDILCSADTCCPCPVCCCALCLLQSGKRSTGQGDAGSGPSSSDSAGGGSSSSSFAARLSASGGGLLPPPPPAGGGLLRPPPPPPSSFVATGSSDTAAAATAAAMRQLRVSGSNSDHVPASQPGARPAAAAATDAGDDWAKFDD